MTRVRVHRTASIHTDFFQDVDVDMVLSDSFPASDPPSWTAGIAEAGRTTVPNAKTEPLPESIDSLRGSTGSGPSLER